MLLVARYKYYARPEVNKTSGDPSMACPSGRTTKQYCEGYRIGMQRTRLETVSGPKQMRY
jgi:hypothetical protein